MLHWGVHLDELLALKKSHFFCLAGEKNEVKKPSSCLISHNNLHYNFKIPLMPAASIIKLINAMNYKYF